MNLTANPGMTHCLIGLIVVPMLLLSGCSSEKPPVDVRLSEKPQEGSVRANLMPEVSDFGLRLRIAYSDLNQMADKFVPQSQNGEGSNKFCKRVIGIKICDRARWQYQLQRTGALDIGGSDDRVHIGVPLEFVGNAGMEGDLAKALGLKRLDFSGAVNLDIKLAVDLDKNWCPVIRSEVEYLWTKNPEVEWAGGLKFSVQSILDKKLRDEMQNLDQRIAESIDCDKFRARFAEHWKNYHFPIDVPQEYVASPKADGSVALQNSSSSAIDSANSESAPTTATLFLNIEPRGFAFSGVKTELDRLGVAFVLNAVASIDTEPQVFLKTASNVVDEEKVGNANSTSAPQLNMDGTVNKEATESLEGMTSESASQGNGNQVTRLPVLNRVAYAPVRTNLQLLLRTPYELLQQLLAKAVVDQTFHSESAAGKVSVLVTDIEIYPSLVKTVSTSVVGGGKALNGAVTELNGSNAQSAVDISEGLTVGLSFDANLPGSAGKTSGKVYLTASPVVDAKARLISLQNIKLSKVLDNKLWAILATVFEGQIISALEKESNIDLAPKMRELEVSLLAQLSDQDRTQGVVIHAHDLQVNLMALVPEKEALATILSISSELDVDLPFTLFDKVQ